MINNDCKNQNIICQYVIFIKPWKFDTADTVDSRYLEVEGTLWNISRYPHLDISDLQNWGKYQSNKLISQMNM